MMRPQGPGKPVAARPAEAKGGVPLPRRGLGRVWQKMQPGRWRGVGGRNSKCPSFPFFLSPLLSLSRREGVDSVGHRAEEGEEPIGTELTPLKFTVLVIFVTPLPCWDGMTFTSEDRLMF